MKTLLSLLLSAIFLIGAPATTFAAKGKAAAPGTFAGKVTAVDLKTHTITLTEKKSGQTKTVSARHATVTVDKQKNKHLADVKVGMKAKVTPGKKGHVHISAKSHSGKKKKKSTA